MRHEGLQFKKICDGLCWILRILVQYFRRSPNQNYTLSYLSDIYDHDFPKHLELLIRFKMFICAISNTPNPIVRCFSFRLVDTFSLPICLNYTLRGSQSSRNFWRHIVESKLIYLFQLSSILTSSMNTFHIFFPTSQGVIQGTISGSLNTTFGRLSSDQTKSTSSPGRYSGSGSCEYTHRADLILAGKDITINIHAFM